jgi:hypothetical protein
VVGSIEEARFSVSALGWPAAFGVLLSVTPYERCTPMVCASSAIKLASSVVATAPSGRAAHATDPNFRVRLAQGLSVTASQEVPGTGVHGGGARNSEVERVGQSGGYVEG